SASRFRFSYVVRLVSVALKLSVLSASSFALSAVPRSWDCKGRRFFLIPKIYFKIFFEAFFEVEISCFSAADISLFPSRCHGRFDRPSLAEWCKDRDKLTILPRPANEYF
ncbi:hypothetical protein, partial [Sphingobacterium sp. UBA6645]|uniref:hypothetical protein n=1 Tax=Sphingobacterium sp. UBA6645 TaxID=1947511 RepID=UPI0025DBD1A6